MVGDILRDTLVDWCEPYRVRRRAFIRMTGEPDIWWLFVDQLPDDPELDELIHFDAEIRDEFKALEKEESSAAFERVLARATAEAKSKSKK